MAGITQLDLDFIIDNQVTFDEMLDDFVRRSLESLLLQRLRERLIEAESKTARLEVKLSTAVFVEMD